MQIELPENLIEEIAERVKQKLEIEALTTYEQSDLDTLEFQRTLARIQAKENISIQEAAFLLNCSDGHIRNLVKKARNRKTRHPIPFLDLDGVTIFNREELTTWSRQPKERLKNLRHEVQSESSF